MREKEKSDSCSIAKFLGKYAEIDWMINVVPIYIVS